MKKTILTILIIIFLISLITVSVYAGNSEAPQYDDKIIFNETYILEENSVLDGNLMAVSSVVIIKENSIITGDVVLIGSSMNMDGEVSGNVMAFGGIVNLFENSIIQGDLVTPGAETYRADGSQIFGQLVTSGGSDLQDSGYFDDINSLLDGEVPFVDDTEDREGNLFSRNVVLNPIARVLWIIFSSFIVSVIAVFVVLLLRKRTEIIAGAFKANPLESVGFGLVTLIIIFPFMTIVFGILAITIILIPVSLTVFIAMALLSFIGWVMACIEFGRMISTALKQEWSDAINAGIGSFLLTFLINILNLVVWDIFGWILGLVFTALGVGALLLTRFGTKAYKNRSEKMEITEKK